MRPNQSAVRRWLHEPLLHFLLLGLAIFVLSEVFSDSTVARSGQIIQVNRSTLARYAITQRIDLNSDTVEGYLDRLAPQELDELVDSFVAQETMLREARALGLDVGDPVVRQRLVSKLRFLLETVDAERSDPSDAELQEYYNAHLADYQQPALLTFSHVFFDFRQGGKATALRRAQEALQGLNKAKVTFGNGPPQGDPYHYQPSYVQRSLEMISNHFSTSMRRDCGPCRYRKVFGRGPWSLRMANTS